jgi:hypothetical protein
MSTSPKDKSPDTGPARPEKVPNPATQDPPPGSEGIDPHGQGKVDDRPLAPGHGPTEPIKAPGKRDEPGGK